MITIHCDGGCRNNQSKINTGGWGAIIIYKDKKKEIKGGTRNTTNNIMELTSCIESLRALKRKDISIEVIMDSQYVIDGINSWYKNWIKNGWKTSTKKPVENKELWVELIELKSQFKDITFTKCKGHSNNVGNNRADELANEAMDEIA